MHFNLEMRTQEAIRRNSVKKMKAITQEAENPSGFDEQEL